MSSLSTIRSYELPVWAKSSFTKPPHHGRLQLANLPTPLYQITTNTNNNNRNNNNKNATSSSVLRQKLHQLGCTFWIKRDDATGGVELGGNKIRKLEFLLAEAISTNCDCVVTIGGEQSNHCRATAAASAMLGLAPHLILRCTNQNQNRRTTTTTTTEGDIDTIATYDDTNNDRMGTVGNILFDRMVGSHIYTCTVGEYGRMGSQQLVHRVCGHLRTEGKIPYAIPVGGSNGLGSFGYIEAVDEIMKQLSSSISSPVDHICFACGSGGTAAGIAIGMALYHQYYDIAPSKRPHIHAMGVCDDPDYFYTHVTKIAKEMGLVVPTNKNDDDDDDDDEPTDVEGFIRSSMTVHQCKGLGYAVSTDEELEFLTEFARETGVVLDPVYSGKALYNLSRLLDSNPDQFRGKTILFWHTGGALGLFDKCNHLHLGQKHSPCTKLDVYGKGIGLDVSSSID